MKLRFFGFCFARIHLTKFIAGPRCMNLLNHRGVTVISDLQQSAARFVVWVLLDLIELSRGHGGDMGLQ